MEECPVVAMIRDEELLDDLVRLAAAAGCAVERVPDAAGARRRWGAAPLVLLDEAAAEQAVAARLPRREGVVVVCRAEPPSTVWERAVAVGAEHVVSLPEAEEWLVTAFSDAVEDAGPRGRVLAVIGGRGGAGASVLAVAVAVAAAASGERALLVDCDPLGGGLDLVLGIEDEVGPRWPDRVVPEGRVAVASPHTGLPALPAPAVSPAALPGPPAPVDGSLTVMACGRSGTRPGPQAAAAVVEAGRRAGETVVADLPRHLTDAALAVLDLADLAVLVLPAEVRACAAAVRVAERVLERGVRLHVVVRGPAPGGLAPQEVADVLGLPLLTGMRPEPGLAGALDRGQLPGGRRRGPLARAAGEVLAALRACGADVGGAAA